MSDQNSTSPAVASLHEEQARQRTGKGDLQKGLEDTFPASDPVSHTTTTTATSTSAPEEEQDTEEAPKVDEALAAVKARQDTPATDHAIEEVRALRSELGRITESAQEALSASARITRSEIQSAQSKVIRQVRKRPLQALGLAALVGYVWGMTR
ncbi:hypothetical protein [Agrobacterium larrymoorei]|uniref:ElaB/YqjD/DUF883 family membrane-anchored ribosome-binding protein n=1 Tax=Agrobacterium larrymoorei TaxID=160699 RepID=A0ABU0UEP3_9HYPH|nr:hypothetical protein [Agrobacterium larrymoorei]MDQ1183353.1 ElaB/YqjD/DUF883 family membrane-anchored ribosome-binding protein [Agrobacterium larrymoorei]